jgi:basic amino acid/polyamine antiporter, APA family
MFSYTTGGPFGLEDMVTTSGPGMTLIYLLVLPFFWCIPVSLVSAELTTAMPVEGGFYRWTRAAFGDFWGFLAGWWNWSASFLLGRSLCRSLHRLSGLLLSLPSTGGSTTSSRWR